MAENGIFRSPLSAAIHLALIKSIGFDLNMYGTCNTIELK
jgi:hypothetical protein